MLWVLSRWGFIFCVRSSPLWGNCLGCDRRRVKITRNSHPFPHGSWSATSLTLRQVSISFPVWEGSTSRNSLLSCSTTAFFFLLYSDRIACWLDLASAPLPPGKKKTKQTKIKQMSKKVCCLALQSTPGVHLVISTATNSDVQSN